MTETEKYYQCRLRKGSAETTGWIEARGAYVGKSVELLPSKELWEVVEVGNMMPKTMLKEHQFMHRGSLPSVDPIGRR